MSTEMVGEHPQMWAQQIQYIIAMAKKDGCTITPKRMPDHLEVTKNGETWKVRL